MKFFIVLCFTISAAVFANGFPSKVEANFGLLGLDFDTEAEELGINGTLECINKAIESATGENTALGSLINEIQAFATELVQKAQTCNSLQGPKKNLCLVKLYVSANAAFKKLLESVTDEQKQALNDLQQAIVECIVN